MIRLVYLLNLQLPKGQGVLPSNQLGGGFVILEGIAVVRHIVQACKLVVLIGTKANCQLVSQLYHRVASAIRPDPGIRSFFPPFLRCIGTDFQILQFQFHLGLPLRNRNLDNGEICFFVHKRLKECSSGSKVAGNFVALVDQEIELCILLSDNRFSRLIGQNLLDAGIVRNPDTHFQRSSFQIVLIILHLVTIAKAIPCGMTGGYTCIHFNLTFKGYMEGGSCGNRRCLAIRGNVDTDRTGSSRGSTPTIRHRDTPYFTPIPTPEGNLIAVLNHGLTCDIHFLPFLSNIPDLYPGICRKFHLEFAASLIFGVQGHGVVQLRQVVNKGNPFHALCASSTVIHLKLVGEVAVASIGLCQGNGTNLIRTGGIARNPYLCDGFLGAGRVSTGSYGYGPGKDSCRFAVFVPLYPSMADLVIVQLLLCSKNRRVYIGGIGVYFGVILCPVGKLHIFAWKNDSIVSRQVKGKLHNQLLVFIVVQGNVILLSGNVFPFNAYHSTIGQGDTFHQAVCPRFHFFNLKKRLLILRRTIHAGNYHFAFSQGIAVREGVRNGKTVNDVGAVIVYCQLPLKRIQGQRITVIWRNYIGSTAPLHHLFFQAGYGLLPQGNRRGYPAFVSPFGIIAKGTSLLNRPVGTRTVVSRLAVHFIIVVDLGNLGNSHSCIERIMERHGNGVLPVVKVSPYGTFIREGNGLVRLEVIGSHRCIIGDGRHASLRRTGTKGKYNGRIARLVGNRRLNQRQALG